MHHHTTTAGYFNFSLKEKLEARYPNGEPQALLRQLSAFHITSDFSMASSQGPLPSEIVVLHNLMQRGLPTLPSMALERALTALGYTKEEIGDTSISYPVTPAVDDKLLEEVFMALHVVDNRFDPSYRGILESKFEEEVFRRQTDKLPYLRQLLTPQEPLANIITDTPGFQDQRADFILPLLYPLGESNAGESRVDGYIVEVDGKPYHSSFQQQLIDHNRDSATAAAGWSTRRIWEKRQALKAFSEMAEQPFVASVGNHYKREINGHWGRILQLALSPFAVARVQQVILKAILTGFFNLEEKKWEIVVVERDVPCARLAIDDLNEWIQRILTLSGRTNIPRIELKKVFVSKEFVSEGAHSDESVQIGSYDGTSCDLLIDVSVLRRYGMELDLTYSCRHAIVRSERWPWVNRQVLSSTPLQYGSFAELKNERWQALPDREGQLTWFLQNIFRKRAFRPGQIEIMQRALNNQTVIGLLPTGGGKSLTYQLAALLQPGITLVIDPLRSLMKDQVINLEKVGVDACALMNSNQSKSERDHALHRLMSKEILLFFISPERLMMETFRSAVNQMLGYLGFSYCVIDEVHCVSEWGHDFRTAYLALGRNAVEQLSDKNSGKKIPLFGLTATASYDVLADVERELLLQDEPEAVVRAEYSGRDEVFFEVVEVPVEFETYSLKIQQKNTTIFIVNPIKEPQGKSIRAQVAAAKKEKLLDILKKVPLAYGKMNNEQLVRGVLDASYDEFLDSTYQTDHPKESWISDKWEKIKYYEYNPAAFFEQNGGLIFAPHREGVFGVTDKYKIQKDENGRSLRDESGNPQWISPSDRNAVADHINCFGIAEAVPIQCEDEKAGRYVGTFVGSSDTSPFINKFVDKDSFRNQDWFIQGKLKLMVATKAFGMGIDKSNIRFTVHINSPSSPESFVQEAGRAGRDGKLAISYVLLNKQKVFAFRKKHFRILAQAGHIYPYKGQLVNRFFQEMDFRVLLEYMHLPAIEELKKWPNRPFEEINVDEDLLNYFHENSFKGAEIEKATIKEILFSRITFPSGKHKEIWEQRLEEEFNIPIIIDFWQKNGRTRLYLKDPETQYQYGHIDVNNWTSHDIDNESQKYHDFLVQVINNEMSGVLPDANQMQIIFNNSIANADLPGVLEYLNSPEDASEFLIGFNNHYTESSHKTELFQLITDHLIPNFQEKQHDEIYKNASSNNFSFEDYFDDLPHLKDDFRGTQQYEVFKSLWYACRKKSDTEKAIYRMSCLGILDDFTVDFRSKTYSLTISAKTPGQYMMALYAYARRYYSEDRVRHLLHQFQSVSLPSPGQPMEADAIYLASEKSLKDLFTEMVDFVVDFSYQEIAAKRRAAITDIFRAYDDYLNNEQSRPGSGNFALKSYLFFYFNSKYAREKYEAKLVNP